VSGGAISAADHPQALRLLDAEFAICHVDLDQAPSLAELDGEFVAITRTPEEITVICPESSVPPWMRAEHGWRALVVEAPFELASAVGVLTALTAPIAAAGIALFAVSTWRTDYILVRGDRLAEALDALRLAGHRLRVPEPLRW
jgi:uncharacterized protein